MGRRKTRGSSKQRLLEFQQRPYSTSKRRKTLRRLKSWVVTLFIFTVCIGIGLASRKYYIRVVNLRVARAFTISKLVLKQTQRPDQEQERYAQAVAKNCVEKGLSPAIVSAMIVVESGGNPLMVSTSGDLGLMQVNARIHAKAFDFEQSNLLNPEENIRIGTSILKLMVERHGEGKALQAYNGLLPAKREYAPRVLAVIARAGIPTQGQTVVSNPSLAVAISDWITAFRNSSGS